MKVILIFFALVGFVYADTEKPPKFPGGGAADLLGNTKFDPDKIPKSDSGTKIKLGASCINSSGTVSGKDAPGYNNCMVEKNQVGRGAGAAERNTLPVIGITNAP
jgi:hypothetical protein